MDSVQKDLENRKSEIKNAMVLMFKANMTITDWDVPEGDDKEAAKILISIMQEALNEIKVDIEAGKYDYF